MWDAWPDIDVTLAEPTGVSLLSYLEDTEEWQQASLLHRVFFQRRLESGMMPPMGMTTLGDDAVEVIIIPAEGEDGLVC